LYWSALQIDPQNPTANNRDRFILSKGHAAPVLFQVLAEKGFYGLGALDSYGQGGSVFGEHPPSPDHLAGIEAATGSLGHGLPMGLGMALASRITHNFYRVFAILGDGECNEGSVWEAAMMASAQKVSNLMVFVDYNKWQATGRSDEVLGLAPLADKWKAFGWACMEVDGNSFEEIESAYNSMANDDRPKAIIAHTVKGRGTPFMEDDNNWHYRIPTADEVCQAAEILGIPSEQIQLDGRKPISHG